MHRIDTFQKEEKQSSHNRRRDDPTVLVGLGDRGDGTNGGVTDRRRVVLGRDAVSDGWAVGT